MKRRRRSGSSGYAPELLTALKLKKISSHITLNIKLYLLEKMLFPIRILRYSNYSKRGW